MSNGKSLIVRVNDRGPYHGNRLIDVSNKAAELLEFKGNGVAKVRVEYVGRAPLEGSDDRQLIATLRTGIPAPSPSMVRVASARPFVPELPSSSRGAIRGEVPMPEGRPYNLGNTSADMARFSYCFISPEGSDYPPILTRHSIEAGESQTILGKGGAVKMTAFLVQHGQIPALGYRIGNAAYTPDLNDIPRESWGALENLDLWIVDGLRYITHSSHFSINDALSWIERFKPKRAVITNMR